MRVDARYHLCQGPRSNIDTQSSEKALKTVSVSDFSVCVRPHAGFLLIPAVGPEASRAQNNADGGVAETLWDVGCRGGWRPQLGRKPPVGHFLFFTTCALGSPAMHCTRGLGTLWRMALPLCG